MFLHLLTLAQTAPPVTFTAEQVAGIIIAILALSGGGGAFIGKKISDSKRVRVEPNPLPVEIVKTLATKEQVDEVEEKLEERIRRIEEAVADERKVARESLGKVHGRIDKVVESLAEMRGEFKQGMENLNRLLERHMKG